MVDAAMERGGGGALPQSGALRDLHHSPVLHATSSVDIVGLGGICMFSLISSVQAEGSGSHLEICF